MSYVFEELLMEIDNISLNDESISVSQASAIIAKNDRSRYGCINDAFKLGYVMAQGKEHRQEVQP
ncbi:hypothetical protein HNQ56_004395 [Anaerotaenia torta]|uniref:hypothetical protein n=1 Tax=Anaerotaenia torta TaxID=433293 RepID=UPI003D193283